MSEQKILHKHTVKMINNEKDKLFFVDYYEGDVGFHMKQGSGTTTVFSLSKKQFFEIAKKIAVNFIKKQTVVTKLISVIDNMQFAYEDLSEKIGTKQDVEVYTDLRDYNKIRTNLVNFKNKVKRSDFIY